jgi:hypothetical protein
MRIYGDRGQKYDQLHFSAFEAGRPELAWIAESDLIEATLTQAIRFSKNLQSIEASVDEVRFEPNTLPTLSLSNGQIITTVQGQDVTVSITNGNVFINEAQVTVADVPASNGVVRPSPDEARLGPQYQFFHECAGHRGWRANVCRRGFGGGKICGNARRA